ncbi:hypothetical protein HFRIS_002359 [Herbaspirillum frisingense GSF30]|uniref:Uncharacterized protein n=2 Tax=Herbaspirillum frisingense TaxID=92645 RepID=A0AAI9IIA0_9BURK|nr:hypothetical protein HFRIS_002359 [Herbaspirillum frisingense GSF30]
MRVTKLDSARRQLVTAIRLFFDGGDFVSVYSLASNAWEVIDALCEKANVESFSKEARESLQAGHTLKYYINEPCRNFFKHANQDPDPGSSVELSVSNVQALLFLAVEDYLRYRRGGPIEAQVFQAWFVAVFPEKIADNPDAQSKLKHVGRAFPGITTLASVDQIKMGREVLEAAYKDEEVVGDPRTEPSL